MSTEIHAVTAKKTHLVSCHVFFKRIYGSWWWWGATIGWRVSESGQMFYRSDRAKDDKKIRMDCQTYRATFVSMF